MAFTTNKLIHGDCLPHLRTFPPDSIDLVCTDPPYGIGFMGKRWDRFESFQNFVAETGKELLRVMKPGALLFMTMSPRQDSLVQAISGLADAGFNVSFTSLYWTFAAGFPKALNIGKAIDKRDGVSREVVGTRRLPDIAGGNYGQSKKRYATRTIERTRGTHPLEGAYGGFQPKPAVEVVLVAMKPLGERTFVGQALANGKGITWLDRCRVPATGPISIHDAPAGTFAGGPANRGSVTNYRQNNCGRFPANLLVSDDVLDTGSVRTSMSPAASDTRAQPRSSLANRGRQGISYSDCYSQYFSLDAWASTLPFLKVPKAKKRAKLGNTHPTVKPLALMAYLVTLGSRPGDLVLDPFAGSGTTLVAAKQLGRRYLGIEREAAYVAIARKRIVSGA